MPLLNDISADCMVNFESDEIINFIQCVHLLLLFRKSVTDIKDFYLIIGHSRWREKEREKR